MEKLVFNVADVDEMIAKITNVFESTLQRYQKEFLKDQFLSREEVSEILDYGLPSLDKLLTPEPGKIHLKSSYVGGKVRILWSDLLTFMKETQRK